MSNYKNILKKKADFLQYLLNEHKNVLSDMKKEEFNNIIYNAYQIINGRIDDLDENFRKKAIMSYSDKLDNSLQFFSNIEKKHEIDDER
ncbi:MAG: hypothetical protein J5881_01205 [Clostridia bacterium]|nr:hypothetical protein [Clostridia bacterium]